MTESAWLSVRNLIKLDTVVFVYKEVNNLHPEQADSPFHMLHCLHSHNTRSVSNNKLFIPRGKKKNFQKTMLFSGSKIWNEIPIEIRMAQTLQSFKDHLKKHLATQQDNDSMVCSSCGSMEAFGRPVQCGRGILFMGCLGGRCADRGYGGGCRSCVRGFPTGRLICLGLG